MTKIITEYKKKNRGLPIRWMSIESIKESIFTTSSDVVRILQELSHV